MAIFRRKPKVPDWASFMTPDDYARFLELVGHTLDSRGLDHRIEDGVAVTDSESYGLVTLAQQLRGEEDWAELVERHFERLLASDAESIPDAFEEAAPLLRARLIHPELIENAPAAVAARPVADLVLALTCDFPETVGYVRDEDVDRWGRPFDELLELGLRQVREREEPPAPESVDLPDGTTIRALFGDSLFTSTHALWVEEGLMAIPHRHAILTHPLEDARAIPAINHLIGLGRRMFEEGPGSISDQLYWKRGEELIHLPVRHEEDRAAFYPPDEFVELLNGLD